MSLVYVSGEVHVRFSVELPEARARDGQACEDPAVEAVLAALPQHVCVHIWGTDEEGAHVYLEVDECDVTVEDDDRDPA